MFLHRCSQQRHSALWRRKSRDQRQKSLYKDGGKERKSEEEEEDDFELDEDDEDDDVDSPDEKDDPGEDIQVMSCINAMMLAL